MKIRASDLFKKDLLIKLQKVKDLGYRFKYDPTQGSGCGGTSNSKIITIGRMDSGGILHLCERLIEEDEYFKSNKPQEIIDLLSEAGILI
jgi:hypothetical protein